MNFAFDIISDLDLQVGEKLDWEGKPTSLFCIVAGNLSKDLGTTRNNLRRLAALYQGVFFIDGTLENPDIKMKDHNTSEVARICNSITNVVYLHNNVVVVDGIALVGLNGWFGNYEVNSDDEQFQLKCNRYEDVVYLERTLEKLQLHVDVKKIIVISNCVPSAKLYFGETNLVDSDSPIDVLHSDTENKIAYWVFGTHKKIVDTTIGNINYVNNPKHDRDPYYPKRINVTI